MVAQTPAFPGAWQPTPVPSARKKSILKVRFDVESEATASDVNHERMPDESSRLPIASGWKADRLPALNPDAHGSLALFEEESTVERTPVPARARRKGPSVRVVDAFGRETLEEEDVKPDVDSLLAGPVPAGSRNRSKVKIVDALGREVKDEGNGAEAPLSHKEALDRVRRGIADMAEDLDDMDRSFEAMAVDDKRINALEDASRGAREARQKIAQSLKFVQDAENDGFWPLKDKIHNGGLLPAAIADTRLRWNSWLFWCFIIVQLVLLAVLYRMSYVRAKRIFLTTYYDPFYADLYLYPFHADTLDHAIPAPSWSIYSVPDTFARSGWLGVLGELWGNATCAVSHWQRQTIEVWRPNLQGEASSSWPPQ
ncbi:hypothetical protein WOLCODRAFT_26303 [Wolfiporia cocos MD-104 SS10]|uniref:Uncharacterized protein n=1 Tax=Wolfiporia cocos (strain MD-104) TaxID=742152 RepID=A0A2H3JPT9_WOLCO|nr:hypothetical protein WOLCODRAFT_26303 [Wolfiporia cocos MD-104 SS10]